jgi:hypothetical protein
LPKFTHVNETASGCATVMVLSPWRFRPLSRPSVPRTEAPADPTGPAVFYRRHIQTSLLGHPPLQSGPRQQSPRTRTQSSPICRPQREHLARAAGLNSRRGHWDRVRSSGPTVAHGRGHVLLGDNAPQDNSAGCFSPVLCGRQSRTVHCITRWSVGRVNGAL